MKQLILISCAVVGLAVGVPALAASADLTGGAGGTMLLGQAVASPTAHATIGSPATSTVLFSRLEQHRGGRAVAGRAPTGRPVVGQAVARNGRRGRVFLRAPFFFPAFSPAFGLAFAYDPFFWGGWGYPYSWWGYPFGYPPYGYGYGYGYPRYGYQGYGYAPYGSVKLDVRPKDAEVYVDGYYMGQVRDFSGVFHHLDLAPGDHKIEVRGSGYQPLAVQMKIAPGRTVTYRGDLRR